MKKWWFWCEVHWCLYQWYSPIDHTDIRRRENVLCVSSSQLKTSKEFPLQSSVLEKLRVSIETLWRTARQDNIIRNNKYEIKIFILYALLIKESQGTTNNNTLCRSKPVWEEKAVQSSVNKDRNIHCLNCDWFAVFRVWFFTFDSGTKACCSHSKQIISFREKRKHKHFLNKCEETVHVYSRSSISDSNSFRIFIFAFKLLSVLKFIYLRQRQKASYFH